jgi:ATP-dependent RNA helicase RhlB
MKTEHSTKDFKNEKKDLDNRQTPADPTTPLDASTDTNSQQPADAEVAETPPQTPDQAAEDSLNGKGPVPADGSNVSAAEINLTDDDDDDDDESIQIPVYDYEVDSFDDLDLEPELYEVIKKLGWTNPTPVQGKCLPLTTTGRDVAGFAQTGTGKTGVFLITLANTIKRAKDNQQKGWPKAIILVPTRELAVQIHSDAQPFLDSLSISSLAVYGGVDYEKQANRIKQGVDVIVATPGRLKDYFQKGFLNLKHCNQFVCDEADRMFDMGFVEDIEFFLSKLTEKTQKLLFSATTNDEVRELAFEYLEAPEYISVNPEVMTPERIEQHAILCESTQKLRVMLGLLREHQPSCAIIFTNTKLVAEWLHYKLTGNGIEADLITGDLPQRKRISLINRIKNGEIKALIATDVASRGLHISGITHVYNFDLPNEASNYVHRIGRTARAGARGHSYSLVCEDYGHNLQDIKDYLGDQVQIDTEWYKEEYLDIEDQAGNPYQDPDFKGNSMRSESSSQGRNDKRRSNARNGGKGKQGGGGDNRRRQGGGGDNRRQQGGGQKPRNDRSRGDDSQNERRQGGQKKRRAAGSGGGQGGQQRQHSRKKRSGQHPNRRRQQPKKTAAETNQQPKSAANSTQSKQAETPSSIGGMFKKIVSVMFGRKNK